MPILDTSQRQFYQFNRKKDSEGGENIEVISYKPTCTEIIAYKLNKPAGYAYNIASGAISAFNGYSFPISMLSISAGWPTVLPTLIKPFTLAGVIPMAIGASVGLGNTLKHKGTELIRKDYELLTSGFNNSTFTLQTIIANYVLAVATIQQKPTEEVDASIYDFSALVIASLILGMGPAIYNIVDNHRRHNNPDELSKSAKLAKILEKVAKQLTIGSTLQASANAIGEVGFGFDMRRNYPVQEGIYGASVLVGLLVTYLTHRSKNSEKVTNVMLEFLSFIAIAPTLYQLFNVVQNDENVNDDIKYGLSATWLTFAFALPVIATLGKMYSDKRKANANENSGTHREEAGKEEEKEPLLSDQDGKEEISDEVDKDGKVQKLDENQNNILREMYEEVDNILNDLKDYSDFLKNIRKILDEAQRISDEITKNEEIKKSNTNPKTFNNTLINVNNNKSESSVVPLSIFNQQTTNASNDSSLENRMVL